jgi:hypothetical protein
MEKVKCAECGYLGVRYPHTDVIESVYEDVRTTGRMPVY